MTTRLLRALLILLLLPGLGGCWALLPNPDQQSAYNLDVYFKGDPKAQALALAAEKGNVQEVQRLMKQEGVSPDTIFSTDGMPLLAWPIYTHSPEGLRAMLENGADPNAQEPGRRVQRFNDGSVLNHALYGSPMVLAAKQKDPIYLKLLLDHGGNPNARNTNNETLLLQAFLTQDQWQNVKLLVERGADVNAKSQSTTILFDYTAQGKFEQTYWLLEHGADPEFNELSRNSNPPVIDDIFWHPGNPKSPAWQRKCQQWLLQHGYKRSPMPEHLQRMRKSRGLPSQEKDIPLL